MLRITMGTLNGEILPIITSVFSFLFTLGFMGISEIPLNILTFIIPMLIIVIESTEDIHILSEDREGVFHNKDIIEKVIHYMASKVGTAIYFYSPDNFFGFFIHFIE